MGRFGWISLQYGVKERERVVERGREWLLSILCVISFEIGDSSLLLLLLLVLLLLKKDMNCIHPYIHTYML